MLNDDTTRLNQESQAIWEQKAGFWDDYIGAEGNQFHQKLVAPAVRRLLDVHANEHVLDVACGNGQFSRELAGLGAKVLATDFSNTFLERARGHTQKLPAEVANRITYMQVDATDEYAMLALEKEGTFDAAVSNMALMDMPTIAPLMRAIQTLLKPGGRFVFSIVHPCFNQVGNAHVVEEVDVDGGKQMVYAIKISRYLTAQYGKGMGIRGESVAHYYWDRPLHLLLADAFAAGLVLDGMEEPAFSPDDEQGSILGWGGKFSEIPPVLVCRLRKVM